ncbi:DUF4265 domain-containing protein [Actinoplanes subtropicus]|uniref:DUF4265 domain-containing protein n=1 Tax=Actinoplanes subtropicus TaxID=543632 RepID=UPI0014704FC7|nr:DUF4265 domain-containing protein [Actinoplanes subtropicus]
MEEDAEQTHIRVLAGTASSGRPVFEVLPARRLGEECEVHGSPGLAYGFAAGDRIRLRSDGTFEVVARDGNLCLRLYPSTRPVDGNIEALKAAFARLRGLVEMPSDRRFIVITVPVSAGFPAVEKAVSYWAAEQECTWEFGNVYDENDDVLDWVAELGLSP